MTAAKEAGRKGFVSERARLFLAGKTPAARFFTVKHGQYAGGFQDTVLFASWRDF
ncbi:MAG: hypothetical protein LBC77_03965 [Spirochaetaceae bacterium]|jgi:hypothetical protein|nr:hypothetical protein [Spirochaetaceae bacterium]